MKNIPLSKSQVIVSEIESDDEISATPEIKPEIKAQDYQYCK